MNEFEDLDRLSSKEVRQQAVSLAERRRDVGFFWRLLKVIPEAEVASGHLGEGEEDVRRPAALLYDFLRRDEKLDDALRPVYLEYLVQHGGGRPDGE